MARQPLRAGIGFDVHPFDASRRLVIGGVEIGDSPGLAGWSDADVLCHAIVDAMLGSAGAGDLGSNFSQEEVRKGSSSLDLLSRARILIGEAGYRVINVDSTVIIQGVRMGPYRAEMEQKIAESLDIEPNAVNVKATTTDLLGFVGRGEGAAAMAVVLVEEYPLG